MASESGSGKAVCSECGQTEFTWGSLIGYAGQKVEFKPDGPFLESLFTKEQVRVRKCASCGNLQLFSEG